MATLSAPSVVSSSSASAPVAGADLLADEQAFQPFELDLLALANRFFAQQVRHSRQDGQRPLALEDPVRCQVVASLGAVSLIRLDDLVEW